MDEDNSDWRELECIGVEVVPEAIEGMFREGWNTKIKENWIPEEFKLKCYGFSHEKNLFYFIFAKENCPEGTYVQRWIRPVYELIYFGDYEKADAFVKHIKNHFSKEHPDWKVCCKICNKDIDEIYSDPEIVKTPKIVDHDGGG